MSEGVIEFDETISSTCTNSETEISGDIPKVTELLKEEAMNDSEKPGDNVNNPDSDQDGKKCTEQASNEEECTSKETQSSLEQTENNVAVKKPRLQYSREELMTLMHHPLSRKWPQQIDVIFQKMQGNSMKIDLDRLVKFTQEKKRPGQSLEGADVESLSAGSEKAESEQKKLRDPRERIKQEEQDGIVLSPQRRSFGTGCRVQHHLPNFFLGKRVAEVPCDSQSSRDMHRDTAARRIGSGRIVRREDVEGMPDNREYRPEAEIRHRDWRMKNEVRYDKYRDDRMDKRRHYYDDRMQQPDRRDKRRNMDSRRMGYDYEEEAPEWFTGGPSSQNEYIELVGFDEEDKESHGKVQQHKQFNSYVNKKKNSRSNTPTIQEVDETEESEQKPEATKPVLIEPKNDQDGIHFDINNIILGDFLDIDSDEVYHSSGESRLKQFFQGRSSPTQEGALSRSSGKVNNPIDALFGLKEPVIQVTSHQNNSTSEQFTPIASNAHYSVADLFNQNSSLGRLSTQLSNPPSVNDLLNEGKGQALQDIEANLCNQETSKMNDFNRNADQNGALNQFLLNGEIPEVIPKMKQVQQPAILNNAGMENDLIAMLLKNNSDGINQINEQKRQQGQLHVPFNNGMSAPIRQNSPTFIGSQPTSDIHRQLSNHLSVRQQQTNQELIMKVLQQQKKQSQLLHPGFQHQDPIKQLMGGVGVMKPNSQGMLHSDVQLLLQRLANGRVTESQLMAQFTSQNINAQQREAITTVLKLLHGNHGSLLGQRTSLTPSPINLATTPISLSPRVVSPNPEATNMLSAPHVLPQRVSPLMFNTNMAGNPRRPPSHQELVAHTQSILQKALIKQELEKAKEKHRKREHERNKSPNRSMNVLSSIANSMGDSRNGGKSQSPLAFTPTSVMRKMTEKDKNSIQDMNRHSNQTTTNFYQNAGPIVSGNILEQKKEICNKNFLGPKVNTAMCGAQSSGYVMGHNRPVVQQHAPISRHNQVQQVLMRGQGTNAQSQIFGNLCQPGIQTRMQVPPPNPIHQMIPSKNNNVLLGIQSDNLTMAQMSVQRNPPLNLANLFGRDIVNQAQNGKLPELPGGQALSLEEVEKLQQNQANKMLSCYKFVR